MEEIKDKIRKEMTEQLAPININAGQLEKMAEEIDQLKNCVINLTGFIAERLKLTDDEIFNADGITDF